MRKALFTAFILISACSWWFAATPAKHHPVSGKIIFSEQAIQAALKVDQSSQFAQTLELIPSQLPGHDDVLFVHNNSQILLSAMDGKIWRYDIASRKSDVFFDAPLMASGMHESVLDHDEIYFCASHLWGDSYPAGERVGLYRLKLSNKKLEPVVLNVPDTEITEKKVWPLNAPNAPRLNAQNAALSNSPTRPLAFCNDLEISEDGQRIYFSEPFSYAGASMGGGTVAEAIAFNGNGRIWMHDLSNGETRLVAEGFFFLDGILTDLHPGQDREESIISSLTPGFAIVRMHIAGAKAGTSEVVQEGLGGMCDGLDRDTEGNIWCALFAPRSNFISWVHANPWIKHLLLRLPLNSLSQPTKTGVLALSPDASNIIYSAWYEGPKAAHIASAIPGPDGYIYITPFSRSHRGLVRLPQPLNSTTPGQ